MWAMHTRCLCIVQLGASIVKGGRCVPPSDCGMELVLQYHSQKGHSVEVKYRRSGNFCL